MNNSNQHIPVGYKSSPLGIIPEDWEVKRLGEVCTFLDNQRIPIKDADRGKMKGKYPYYGASGIIDYVNDYIFDDDLILLGEDGANIITRSTPLAYLVSGKVWINNHAHVLKANKGYNRYYICNYLESLSYDKYNTGTAQPKLNQEVCEKIPILLPCEKEQNNISNLLSLWDTAISKQTQLVEKLTLRKRGLMQQLLTGKKRLKGFEGEWKEVRLGEVCAFLSNNTLSREQLNNDNGEVQNIHYGDVLIKYPSVLDCNKIVLPFLNEGTYKESMNDFIYDGDLIISDTAEDETVGKACEVQNVGNRKILAGLHTMLLRPNAGIFAPYFLGYYINSEAYHGKLLPLIQGIKVCSIGKLAIQNTTIAIPSIDEQNAIASILIQADKKIELANKKLTRLQEQKKGLMQVLLTGKKRIII